MKIKDAEEHKIYFAIEAFSVGGIFLGFVSQESYGLSFSKYMGQYSGKHRDGDPNILVFYKYLDARKWIERHKIGSNKYKPVLIWCRKRKWSVIPADKIPKYIRKADR